MLKLNTRECCEMFKVPDWEDVPKTNINLKKKSENKKKLEKNVPNKILPNSKKNHIPPPVKLLPKVQDNKKQAKKRKLNVQATNNNKTKYDFDLSNMDTDKADEILLNAKKRKFYEPIEQDDEEELLFGNTAKKSKIPQAPVTLSANGKIFSKIIDKKSQKNKKNKIIKNDKQIPELKNEKPVNSFTVKENTSAITNTGLLVNRRKEKIKALLTHNQNQNNRSSITITGNKLRQRMLDRLKAAQFRYINEKLYTSSGAESKELFQSDPAAFSTYHQGYQQQLKKWPVNPLDVIAKRIQKMPKTHLIADMGCGEAALSKRIPHKVRSFDLVATAAGVETCDMAHTPLLSDSMDVTVYCLALMGTELTQYLVEANRVLKMGGYLLIAEVESRFEDVEAFTKEVMKLGFKLKNLDKKHKVFFFMEFIKVRDPPVKKSKLPILTLKPCLYKKR